MRGYKGSVTLRDLNGIENEDKLILLYHLRRLRAQERIEFQSDIAAVVDDSEETKDFKRELIERAFADNPQSRAASLEAITRTPKVTHHG